jgi:hypothetical protein
VRDLEVIDQELKLLVVVRAAVRREGGRPTTTTVDKLLDERLEKVGPNG